MNKGMRASRAGAPEAYSRHRARNMGVLLALCVVLLLAALLSLRAGSYDTPVLELLKGIASRAEDSSVNIVVRNMRLPRICTAILGGAGLGVAGVVLQSVLRNPLASSSTLGISQGAGFGAAFAIIVLGAGLQAGGGVTFSNPALIGLCAFGGSMAVSVLILALSRLRQITPEAMVLSGVALSSLFSGATTLLQYFADEVQLTSLVFWTFGDLGRTGWDEVGIMAAVAAAAGIYFFFNRWNYNALESGEQTAVSLGVDVGRLRIVSVLLCSVVAAVVVSYVGIINFIGLVAPHIVRRFLGNNCCYLIPGSALMGAVLLLLGDLVARNVVAPVVLPIGAITSFLGAPLFLYLLFKGRNRS